jgi:AmiR/NasT family two-component response regulator
VYPILAAPRLLLVDTDRSVLATLSKGFADAGFQVSTAGSHEEALALLQAGLQVDLGLLSLCTMPFDVPFVVFSACSDAATVEQATAAGALGYLVKPMEVAQMLPTVNAAMARARELQALRQSSQQLQNALQAERDVNVAVGIAMMQHRLGRTDAFNLIRNAARKRRTKLSELALEIVEAGETLSL